MIFIETAFHFNHVPYQNGRVFFCINFLCLFVNLLVVKLLCICCCPMAWVWHRGSE